MPDLTVTPEEALRHAATRDMVTAFSEAAAWMHALATDGPDLMSTSHRKVMEEAAELAEDTILEEWADVAICLLGVALHKGWSADMLADAIRDKVLKNRDREWFPQENGVWRHTEHDPRA